MIANILKTCHKFGSLLFPATLVTPPSPTPPSAFSDVHLLLLRHIVNNNNPNNAINTFIALSGQGGEHLQRLVATLTMFSL